ncbi:hypothetical protein ACJX0J_011876, partial [Zea mays]
MPPHFEPNNMINSKINDPPNIFGNIAIEKEVIPFQRFLAKLSLGDFKIAHKRDDWLAIYPAKIWDLSPSNINRPPEDKNLAFHTFYENRKHLFVFIQKRNGIAMFIYLFTLTSTSIKYEKAHSFSLKTNDQLLFSRGYVNNIRTFETVKNFGLAILNRLFSWKRKPVQVEELKEGEKWVG